ncbi:MAG: CotH kinase family protein [Abditibacteriota bacterium]|nr:CotH kinase family protein [Abditibacteriota bacterium]
MKKKLIALIAVLLLIPAALYISRIAAGGINAADVFVCDLQAERILPYDNNEGAVYVFLPSFADMSDLAIIPKTDMRVDGKSDFDVSVLGVNKPHKLSFKVFGRKTERELIFVKSANTATLFIDTQSGTTDFLDKTKKHRESVSMRVYNPHGTVTYNEKNAGTMGGRGNATWEYEQKKPYSLRLNAPAAFLGMSSSTGWALLSNTSDQSNLRNKTVCDFAARVMPGWTPRSEYVDVYFNGDYRGLYLLTENKEVAPGKIDLASDGKSFLIESDLSYRSETGVQSFTTSRNKYFKIVFPPKCTSDQIDFLTSTFQSIEDGLVKDKNAWNIPLDLDSAARRFLIDEIFINSDCDLGSTFYRVLGDRVYAGPVWDYDNSLGNAAPMIWARTASNPEQIFAVNDEKHIYEDCSRGRLWYYHMYDNTLFREKIKQLYRDEYRPLLTELMKEFPAKAAALKPAAEMNALRQRELAIIIDGEFIPYDKQVAAITDFLTGRVKYLDNAWLGGEKK